jgi:dolichol-phosphate mannosyltransferase
MRHALEMNADVICQMDADLSHQPAQVPRLLQTARDADLLIDSRYVASGSQ